MEKKIIHSGAPFALAGLAVLLMAALFGLGGFFSYVLAALAGAACLLVYHLCLLQWKEQGSLFPAEEAALWSAFSREIEHLEENLTDLIETLFDNETWPLIAALLGE